MPELKRLDLNNNRLKELSGLEGLVNLRYLNLKGNLLTGFDEGFPEMENLQELDIGSNPFSKIKTLDKLANLENLRILKLEKTNISESGDSEYIFRIVSKLVKLEEINNLKVNTSIRQLSIDYTKKKLAEKKRLQKEEEER
jgi:Leucine-rich repeat (LRR) protein